MRIPHTKPAVWPEALRCRFASGIKFSSAEGCTVALLGLPDDTGVKFNGGRIGAAGGPSVFREALAHYGAARPAGIVWPAVFDAGDVVPGASLGETHDRVTEAVEAVLDLGLLPIAIGGGHDLTYPVVRAVAQRFEPLSGIYFDAHLDVRETPGSGMAFRRVIEDCGVTGLELHGFRPFANAAEHQAWFLAYGGRIYADGVPPRLPSGDGNLFASFDLDVLDAAYAPGVSAMNPSGWNPQEAEAWVRALGADPRVRSFDLMELCPAQDEGGRTARLAAHLFLSFLAGFADRK